MSSVKFTTEFSILVQIVTGFIGLQGVFMHVPDTHKILIDILKLETIVQFVELYFYIFVLRSMALQNIPNMAAIRYFDWVLTTPTMLLTTIIFFKYEEHLEKGIDTNLEFWDFIKSNRENIKTIIICNFLMLLFGYLGEIQAIDMTSSLSLGFLFFGMTFYTIYTNYAVKSKNALKMFYFIFTVWGLYGVAALLSVHTKNNMFNILDLFAKNFFGLYLYYRIKSIALN